MLVNRTHWEELSEEDQNEVKRRTSITYIVNPGQSPIVTEDEVSKSGSRRGSLVKQHEVTESDVDAIHTSEEKRLSSDDNLLDGETAEGSAHKEGAEGDFDATSVAKLEKLFNFKLPDNVDASVVATAMAFNRLTTL